MQQGGHCEVGGQHIGGAWPPCTSGYRSVVAKGSGDCELALLILMQQTWQPVCVGCVLGTAF